MLDLPISPLAVNYTTAKKQKNGMYILYWTGTKNKVFDLDFKTPKKAKNIICLYTQYSTIIQK